MKASGYRGILMHVYSRYARGGNRPTPAKTNSYLCTYKSMSNYLRIKKENLENSENGPKKFKIFIFANSFLAKKCYPVIMKVKK